MSENLDLKIRAEMRKRRMTFKELAALVGISGAYLSDILNGNRDGKKAQQHI
ncbi:helix-turn-helix transcriptional regulator, partial [Enterococcus lactis]